MNWRIETLDHAAAAVAAEIFELFQAAYAVEAELVDASFFPPLMRGSREIQRAATRFTGILDGIELVAAIEFTLDDSHIGIDSLVVSPDYFRRGLASALMHSLLDHHDWESADVETAADNLPAIALYEKFQFVEARRWQSDDGISKVQLVRNRDYQDPNAYLPSCD